MSSLSTILYVVAMVIVVFVVDLAFLRGHLGLRLAANVILIAIFGLAYYFLFRRG